MSLPFLFFGIPVGIASDAWGHRSLLFAAQVWMLAVTAVLAFIAWRWNLTPWLLLSMLFLIGTGVVVQQSAWKPFLHDLVPEDKLVAAISFNALSNKIAQAVGPIIGGYLMGVAGTAIVLLARAVSHVIMIVALRFVPNGGAAESGGSRTAGGVTLSLREGWDFLKRSPQLYGPMIRCAVLMGPCAGVLALLPLEAKENIHTGVIGYGGLLAALGAGTTSGVSLMPLLQRHFRLNTMSVVALAVFSLAVLGISRWDSMLLDATFLLFFGFAWSILSVSHQFAVQVCSPEHMRGLMTSFYALVLQGAMAAGSFGFGLIAQHAGVSRSILIAGFVAMGGLVLVRRYPMPEDAPAQAAA